MDRLEQIKKKAGKLKNELDAVIVAHNYQPPEVQDIADFVGDSLELARECANVKAAVIVFCGVRFMAETAAILNPGAQVLLSHPEAGCYLADTIDAGVLRQWKEKYPEAAVVAYVNTSAAVKAESHICCTSANAVAVVNSLREEEVLFVPDSNLGRYVSAMVDKKVLLYPGFCDVHEKLTVSAVLLARQRYPEARVLVHPECRIEVIELADATLSTSQMLRYVGESAEKEFLIGTEEGMLYPLRKQNPDKVIIPISDDMVCSDMKKTTLQTIVDVMEKRESIVFVPEKIRTKARQAIDRMLEAT
jgi:quinolinate synthase